MDLSTISMQKEQAEAAFREYRGAFLAERNRIDGELMRGYKALKAGKQLIRLTETIKAGGADERGRPRLAIARADERSIMFERGTNGSVTFRPNWNIRAADRSISLPAGTLPPIPAGASGRDYDWSATAMLPLIPPRLRPRIDITNFHILWEAEWRRAAPRDPALLRHIGGDLWAVLAVWDLTDLERAVLEMRG